MLEVDDFTESRNFTIIIKKVYISCYACRKLRTK